MRRALPYIVVVVAILLLAVVVVSGSRLRPRQMDQRITLRQRDRIPYGMAATRRMVEAMFPKATVTLDSRPPGEWENILPTSYNQAVVLVADHFNADKNELYELLKFIQNGNHVFLIARTLSRDAQEYFGTSNLQNFLEDYGSYPKDSMTLQLETPPFAATDRFVYPGRDYSSWFYRLDTGRTLVLGRDEANRVNFIGLRRGSGALFMHTAPLAFSNYFLLHKNNVRFLEKAFSLLPPGVERIVWNEYYLSKPNRPRRNEEPQWLRVLFRYPAFKWGLLTLCLTLLLMVLLGMRRRQRMIPEYKRPSNDSMDFVKTMGRLYHERRDHQNLARKMSLYFLEHVRTTYKLPTQELDDRFIRTLQYKSGYPEAALRGIISFTHHLQSGKQVTETELTEYHKQLEQFYQNT